MECNICAPIVVAMFRRSWTKGSIAPKEFQPIVLTHDECYDWIDPVVMKVNTPAADTFCVLPKICDDDQIANLKVPGSNNLKLCVIFRCNISLSTHLFAMLNGCLVTVTHGSIPGYSGQCQIVELLD